MRKVITYDTSLRDGAQGENISFSPEDMLKIAKRLDKAGVHYIEGGWPGSNPSATRFFELASKVRFKKARLVAFGATRRLDKTCEEDESIQAILKADTQTVAIFGKSWDFHVTEIMENTLPKNLIMIYDTISYFKEKGKEVVYDAEHFFDGAKENPEYALRTLAVAINAGADYVVLCDTNGGCLPQDIEKVFELVARYLRELKMKNKLKFVPPLGIHAHNDSAMAVANSILAVVGGASMVQGTVNGYGERCGNADLTSIIPILSLKLKCDCGADPGGLLALSRFVSEVANIIPNSSQPFVGKSAFTHKGGVHVSAVMKNCKAYEHVNPEIVGNERRVLVSEQSGKSNIEYKAEELGVGFNEEISSKQMTIVIKELEDDGFKFNVADASLKLLMQKLTGQFVPKFNLEFFRVTDEKDKDLPCYSHATVKIKIGNKINMNSAEGEGPVDALDNALRKVLLPEFPWLDNMELVDYKVRVINGIYGTKAKVRVSIESRFGDKTISTIGVSEDILEASWHALTDGYQYALSLGIIKSKNAKIISFKKAINK